VVLLELLEVGLLQLLVHRRLLQAQVVQLEVDQLEEELRVLLQAEPLLLLHLQVVPKVDQLEELPNQAGCRWAAPRRL
jgi:hypothetical protein